jgi:hypothetical protein
LWGDGGKRKMIKPKTVRQLSTSPKRQKKENPTSEMSGRTPYESAKRAKALWGAIYVPKDPSHCPVISAPLNKLKLLEQTRILARGVFPDVVISGSKRLLKKDPEAGPAHVTGPSLDGYKRGGKRSLDFRVHGLRRGTPRYFGTPIRLGPSVRPLIRLASFPFRQAPKDRRVSTLSF